MEQRSQSHGFSLIEALVATALLGIIVLFTWPMYREVVSQMESVMLDHEIGTVKSTLLKSIDCNATLVSTMDARYSAQDGTAIALRPKTGTLAPGTGDLAGSQKIRDRWYAKATIKNQVLAIALAKSDAAGLTFDSDPRDRSKKLDFSHPRLADIRSFGNMWSLCEVPTTTTANRAVSIVTVRHSDIEAKMNEAPHKEACGNSSIVTTCHYQYRQWKPQYNNYMCTRICRSDGKNTGTYIGGYMATGLTDDQMYMSCECYQ